MRDGDQWLIVPGNHKLRILDRRRGSVYAILKDGFDPRFLRAEIRARRTAAEHGVPVPRLLRTDEDAGWLEESYVSGTPWNRLTDPALARGVLFDACAALNGLTDATAQSTEVGRHAARLRERCHDALTRATLIDAGLRNDIESLLARVALLLEPWSSAPLETATCHGDFQPANLLWDDRRPWLIDWEYSRRCQRGHDALVWGLATRWPLGLAGRLADFVRGDTVRLEPVFSRFRSFDDAGTSGRQVAALLLILEELQLRLEECVHPCLVALHPTLAELVAESLAWLDGLETRH